MKCILLFSLLFHCSLLALTPAEILKISERKASRENPVPELEIFGKAPGVRVEVDIDFPKGPVKPKPILVQDKVVDGKYFVSQFSYIHDGEKVMNTGIISYNKEKSFYEKWVLESKNKTVLKMMGVRLKGSNIINWITVGEHMKNGNVIVTVDQYNKDKVVWREIYMSEGRTIFSLNGVAT